MCFSKNEPVTRTMLRRHKPMHVRVWVSCDMDPQHQLAYRIQPAIQEALTYTESLRCRCDACVAEAGSEGSDFANSCMLSVGPGCRHRYVAGYETAHNHTAAAR